MKTLSDKPRIYSSEHPVYVFESIEEMGKGQVECECGEKITMEDVFLNSDDDGLSFCPKCNTEIGKVAPSFTPTEKDCKIS